MVELIILVSSVVVCVATGAFVIVRNRGGLVNRLYAFVTLSIVILAIANYLSLQTMDRLWLIRVVIASASLFSGALLLFITQLERNEERFSAKQKKITYVTLAVALLDMTPIIFSGITLDKNPTPIATPYAGIFLVHMVVCFMFTFYYLFQGVRKNAGVRKSQYYFLLYGMMPIVLFAPVTGVLLPVVFGNTNLIAVTPLYGVVLVSTVGYSMIKHKMFDIKLYVVRLLAYILAIILLSAVYIAPIIFGLTYLLDIVASRTSVILLIISISWAAIYYGRILEWFRGRTSQLFFQDAYEAAPMLADLNRQLISIIEPSKIIHSAEMLINNNLKPESVAFFVHDSNTNQYKAYNSPLHDKRLEVLRKSINKVPERAIVISKLEQDSEMYAQMNLLNISVIVPLNGNLKNNKPLSGYLLLGPKKSGNHYNEVDLEVLAAVANIVVIAMQNALHFEEIQQFNETLQQRVDDATRKLRMTNEKLRRLDETKDEFISMASHQLRTPLTSVKGYLSMVVDGDVGKLNKQQRELLTQSYLSSQRMVNLISDLLNLSRLSTGKFVIDYAPVDLREVIDEELTQLRDTAEARGVELVYERPETFPTIRLDDNKTHQVVMNFVDNAIYYTPSGGKVTLELVETPTSIEFRVKDNGIGVPRALQRHLFTKFYRAENARRVRPDGTGLGLFMAKKVIIAQGGSIIFESQEGKGSTFGFRFSKKVLADETRKHPVEIQT
ncbi:MAG: HAMP domain-containing sensor histidine kinase [Candidatus Saccharimonadales bacterium]